MQICFRVLCKILRSPLKTLPRSVFLTLRSIPLNEPKPKEKTPKGVFLLVEARGIEPLSKKFLTGLSPGGEHLLKISPCRRRYTGCGSGSFFVYGRFKSNGRRTFTTKVTPVRVRGPPRRDVAPIRQRALLFYRQRLYLKVAIFIEVPHLCPLILPQAPCRDHYAPKLLGISSA